MPPAERVNFSLSSPKLVAVPFAALLCPLKAPVRSRMVARLAAVASAPPATDCAARSSWRINPPSSRSSSSRISRVEFGFADGHYIDPRGSFCLGDKRNRFGHSLFE